MEQHGLLNDSTFWLAVSFVIFVALVWQFGRKAIAGALDSYAAKVKADLEEAASLRAEAVRFLEETEAKHAGAVREAEAIITKAKEQAAIIETQANKEIEATLKGREAQALERIRLLEEQAAADIKAKTVELALGAAQAVLRAGFDAAHDQKLIDAQTASLASSLKKVA